MTYPKTAILKDGTEITLIEKERDDIDEMVTFFGKLSHKDRLYLMRDVTDREVLEIRARELIEGQVKRVSAYVGNELVGEGSLYHSNLIWRRHVGHMRLIVIPDYQHKGLGSLLAREIFFIGIRNNYKIIEVYILEDDRPALACVEKLGFIREIVLKDFAWDIEDQKHNMVIMTFNVDVMWNKLQNYYEEFEIHSEC